MRLRGFYLSIRELCATVEEKGDSRTIAIVICVQIHASAPHIVMSNNSESINVYFQFDFSDTGTKA